MAVGSNTTSAAARLATAILFAMASLAPCAAHVRMFYNAAAPGISVRNARAPTQDGGFSVAGPCGGAASWGSNGVFTATPGISMALTINYNGGHRSPQNAFRAIWKCSMAAGPSEDEVEAIADDAAQTLTLNTQATTPVANADGTTVAAPNGNAVQEGYTLAFTLPAAAQGRCTVSVLDQRKWGGCVDLELRAPAPPPTAAAPPPTPAPTPPPPGVVITTTATTTTEALPVGMAVSNEATLKDATVINIPMSQVETAGYAIGDTIIIAPGTKLQESNVIAGFGSLILKFPLENDHDSGFMIQRSDTPDERIVPKLLSATYHARANLSSGTCQINLDGCCCLDGAFEVNLAARKLTVELQATGCWEQLVVGKRENKELSTLKRKWLAQLQQFREETDNENFAAAANKSVRVAASSITQTMKATAKLLEVEPPTIEVNGSSLKAEGGALLKLETEDIVIGGQTYHVVLQIGPDILPEVTFSNIAEDAPIYCDGYAEIDEDTIKATKSTSSSKKSGGGGGAAAVIIILLLLAVGVGYQYKTSPQTFDPCLGAKSDSGTRSKGGYKPTRGESGSTLKSASSASTAAAPRRPPPPTLPQYATPTPRAGYGNTYEAPAEATNTMYAEPAEEQPRYGAPNYSASGKPVVAPKPTAAAAKLPPTAPPPHGARAPPPRGPPPKRAPHGPPPAAKPRRGSASNV